MAVNIQAIYTSDCLTMESINNPLVGHEVGMQISGFFNEVQKSVGKAYSTDNIHISRGGLEKTISNGAAIFCKDVTKLFSTIKGGISIRICFPDYGIINGVYQGLLKSKGTIEDHILFGANMGEHYISQPGIYAALTNEGIEFSIWTSAGVEKLIENSVNVEAGDDLVLDFIWEKNGIPNDTSKNIRIFANGNTTSKKAVLSETSFANAQGTGRPASFWILDTPYRKSDLHAIIRRLEIYSSSVIVPRSNPRGISYEMSGISSFNFEIIASQGPCVEIASPDFCRVSIESVDMRAIGPIASTFHKNGQDLGSESQSSKPPTILLDLPPGFVETREASYE